MEYFGGFYCTPSELAENARAQRLTGVVIATIALAYILLLRWLNGKKQHMPRGGRLALNVFTPIISLLLIIFAFLAFAFAGPHWCGNG